MRSVPQAGPDARYSEVSVPETGRKKKRVRKKFKIFSAREGVDRHLFYLILVLLVKPTGLLGKKIQEKV